MLNRTNIKGKFQQDSREHRSLGKGQSHKVIGKLFSQCQCIILTKQCCTWCSNILKAVLRKLDVFRGIPSACEVSYQMGSRTTPRKSHSTILRSIFWFLTLRRRASKVSFSRILSSLRQSQHSRQGTTVMLF